MITPITARPVWNEAGKQFIIPDTGEFLEKEITVLTYVAAFLCIVSEETKISIEKVLKDKEKRKQTTEIVSVQRMMHEFISEFFPSALYLSRLILNKDTRQFYTFLVTQKSFMRDNSNQFQFNVYVKNFSEQYKNIPDFSFEEREIVLQKIQKTEPGILRSEFADLPKDVIIEIIFSTILEKFGVDLHKIKIGEKQEKNQYNVYSSRRILMGIIVSIFGEQANFSWIYPYFSLYYQTAKIETMVTNYKFTHSVLIKDDKIYQILYKIIDDAVLEKVKNKEE
jgi:hypothetical protein